MATNVDDHIAFNDIELQSSSIDDVLRNWVGEFGKAQILHLILTSLAWALEALHTLVTVYADRTPQWACVVNVSSTINHNLINQNDSTILGTKSNCNPSMSICAMDSMLWEWVDKDESTVSQWNLVCENSYKQGLMQSAFFIGTLLGAGIFGNLSDSRFGRKGALVLACVCNAIFGMLTAASPNYVIYVLLRIMTGICSGGLGMISFVLGTESIGPSQRSIAAMSSLYFYPLGMMLLSSLATLSSPMSWRYLYLITSTPSILYCLCILPFLVESPRWYLIQGRSQEALTVLKDIAKRNGNVVPSGVTLSIDFKDDDEDNIKDSKVLELKEMNRDKETHGALKDVFRESNTRIRMIVLFIVWFASALGYYSLNLNVGNLGTNLSMSMMMNALVEVPSYIVTSYLLNRVGRRITLTSSMIVCGFSCIISGIFSFQLPHLQWNKKLRSCIQLGGDLVSLFAIAGTYNLLYLYTAELFPTVVRNAVLGLTNQAGALGSIIAPIIVLSTNVHIGLPFFFVGSMTLLGGIMAIKLPETMNNKFHETLEGMRRYEKEANA